MPLLSISFNGGSAELLVRAAFHALGYDPDAYKLIAEARAKGEAAKIDLQNRAELRKFERRLRASFGAPSDWENLESTLAASTGLLNDDARPEGINTDKLRFILEKVKLVSEEDMQGLWAKVLAGEANDPGSFSKRTIEFVSIMEKLDAKAFTAFCSFCLGEKQEIAVVFPPKPQNIYIENGVDHSSIEHLVGIGLLQRGGIMGYAIPGTAGRRAILTYFDKKFEVTSKDGVRTGDFSLTKVGMELAPISGAKPISGYIEYLTKYWQKA